MTDLSLTYFLGIEHSALKLMHFWCFIRYCRNGLMHSDICSACKRFLQLLANVCKRFLQLFAQNGAVYVGYAWALCFDVRCGMCAGIFKSHTAHNGCCNSHRYASHKACRRLLLVGEQPQHEGCQCGAHGLTDYACRAEHPACAAAAMCWCRTHQRDIVRRLEQSESYSAKCQRGSHLPCRRTFVHQKQQGKPYGKKQHAHCADDACAESAH